MDIDTIKNIDKESDIDLLIDFGSKILLEVEDINIPLVSEFVGFKKNDFFLCSYPLHYLQFKHKLTSETHLLIKYLYKGSVYVFPSKLIEIINQPIQLFVFRYPKFIQSYEIRSYRRVECCLPITVKINEKTRGGIIKDMNEKGCGCTFRNVKGKHTVLYKDNKIVLMCQFPGVEGEKKISGIIKNVKISSEYVEVGIQFHNLFKDSYNTISNYIMWHSSFNKADA